MKNKWLFFFVLAGVIVILDQVTKLYVHTQFDLHESVPVIDNIFHLTYVRNYGAAFGFLANSHPEFRTVFFLTVPLIALIAIVYLMRSVPAHDKWQVAALSCIFSGALGNYVDRLKFGYVVDFLDFHYYELWTYPAFNIADMAIVGGVGTLLILMSRQSNGSGV